MANVTLQPAMAQEFLRLANKWTNQDANDADLLNRFVARQDENAFAGLLARHARLVWEVCRRVHGNSHDAEDSFQATFFVFARKAGKIRSSAALASWLHRLAYRTAMHAKKNACKRRLREELVAVPASQVVSAPSGLQELQAVLDEEVNRLAEKHRAPFVLCCLQGKSKSAAAAACGWKPGTVASRLAQARKLLQDRLTRRGITLSAVLTTTAVRGATASAAIPTALVNATAQTALPFALGQTTALACSAAVVPLANGVLKAMFWQKLKVISVIFLAATFFGTGTSIVSYAAFAARPTALPAAAPPHAEQQPEVAQQKQPHVDLYCDPLPPGAISRMGTIQFRHLRAELPGGAEFCVDPEIGVVFSPDGQIIATSWGGLRLWNANTGNFLSEIQTADPCWGQVFSPDGRFLAAAFWHYTEQKGTEYYVCLWDARTGKLRQRFPAEHWVGHARQLLFSRDSKRLAMADDKGAIHLWHTDTGKEVAVLSSKSSTSGPLVGMAFSPDGKTLVAIPSQPRPREIWHWDIARGEISKVVALDINNEQAGSWSLADDGRTVNCLFVGDRSVRLLDTSTGKVRCQLQGPAAASRSRVAFTPGGRLFATAGYTDEDEPKVLISLWDSETGQLKRHFQIPRQRQLGSLTFSPDGSRVLTGGWYNRMYEVASGKELLSKPAHEGPVYALAFTPDSSTLISGSADSMVGIWDTATGKSRHFLRANRWVLTSVAMVPGGSTFVSGGQDGIIRQHDWRTGKEMRRFGFAADGKHQFKELNVSGDGKTVLSQVYTANESTEASFHAWDLATGKLLRSLPRQGSADVVDLTADGKHFLGVKYLTPDRNNYSIEVRELASGRLQFTMGETDSPGTESLLTADGRLLIHGIYRAQPTIRVRELATGKDRLRIVAKNEGGKWSYEKFAISPDGKILAAARQDKTLQVWDLLTGKELLRQSGYTGSVYTMTFSPNGKFLATGHVEGAILVWDVSLPKRKDAQVVRSAKELDAWYSDLAGEDAARAHTAIWNLVEVPEQAVGLFKERLRPAPDKHARIVKLIAQLDDAKFAVRQVATKELKMLGSEAEPALRQALDQKPTLEKRRRLEKLLDRPALQVQDPEVLQGIRALEVLEYIAPASADATRLAAMELLKQLASGAPQAQLTQQAQAGLRRLQTRQP